MGPLKFRAALWAVILITILASCRKSASLPTDINTVRPTPAGIRTVEIEISRQDYQNSLKKIDLLSRMRVVPIVTRPDEAAPAPEYRLFNISEESAPYMLGLRNADVLVAASGVIVYEAAKFRGYLYLLQNEKQAEIEIRRAGEPILLKYTFH